MAPGPYLATLNDAQKQAVIYKAKGSLQILAGPGSGKTKTLTCRVAHLLDSGVRYGSVTHSSLVR